jgi:hypothetical protein
LKESDDQSVSPEIFSMKIRALPDWVLSPVRDGINMIGTTCNNMAVAVVKVI